MKNLVFILLASSFCYSQELKRNSKDEFTGNFIKETNWEMITSLMSKAQLRISAVSSDTLGTALHIKFMASYTSPTIMKGADLMFKMENGEIITIRAVSTQFPCIGCGATGLAGSEAPGVMVYYRIIDDKLKILSSVPAKKARIYTSDGYFDCDITEKGAKRLMKCLQLVQ